MILTSFEVDSVKPELPKVKHPGRYENSRNLTKESFEKYLSLVGLPKVEGRSINTTNLVQYQSPNTNSFLETCRRSYDDHVPLVLGPDEVWTAVVQAVSSHVRVDPEAVRRSMGVTHDGNKTITVELNGFTKGDPNNRWESAFGKFSDALAESVGKRRDLFDPTFSTTGITEKAVMQVQMLDAYAAYFEYFGRTMCGIPSISLLGTIEDWKSINARVNALSEILPPWIHGSLALVTTELETAASGNPNREFWQNFLKVNGGSGGPYINGFINAFFPYLGKKKPSKNYVLRPEKTDDFDKGKFEDLVYGGTNNMHGPNPDDMPGSVCSVPMTWLYYNETIEMKFAAGIVGVTAHESENVLGYRCVMGWAVGESAEPAGVKD